MPRESRSARATKTNALYRAQMGSVKKCIAKDQLDHGATYREVRLLTGLDDHAIADIKAGRIELDPKILAEVRAQEDSKMTFIRGMILDDMVENPKLLAKASLKDHAVTLGLLTRDQELLAGRPTSRDARLLELDDLELAEELLKNEGDFQRELHKRVTSRMVDAAVSAAPLLIADQITDVEPEPPK